MAEFFCGKSVIVSANIITTAMDVVTVAPTAAGL